MKQIGVKSRSTEASSNRYIDLHQIQNHEQKQKTSDPEFKL